MKIIYNGLLISLYLDQLILGLYSISLLKKKALNFRLLRVFLRGVNKCKLIATY